MVFFVCVKSNLNAKYKTTFIAYTRVQVWFCSMLENIHRLKKKLFYFFPCVYSCISKWFSDVLFTVAEGRTVFDYSQLSEAVPYQNRKRTNC